VSRVVILQSNYMPWRGYFDLINDCDLFIFYDCVQYTRQDWRNRNLIKTAQGLKWLSVPVGTSVDRLLRDVAISDDAWRAAHLKTIEHAHSKCAAYSDYIDFFRDIYSQPWRNLSELNRTVITRIANDLLGCTTTFMRSADLGVEGTRTDALVNLLEKVGASSYISGPAAKSYLEVEKLNAAGIEVQWKDYSGYPDYPQRHGPFEPQVSIIDLLLNTGADAAQYIWGWRSQALSR